VLEHDTGHHSVTIERERATRVRQLATGDVSPLRELGLAILQRREHEEIRVLVESRLTKPDAIHDSVAEGELRQQGGDWG
jgi:hypothetical protein